MQATQLHFVLSLYVRYAASLVGYLNDYHLLENVVKTIKAEKTGKLTFSLARLYGERPKCLPVQPQPLGSDITCI